MNTIKQLQTKYLLPRLVQYKEKLLEERGMFLRSVIRRTLPWNREVLQLIDKELARIEELIKELLQ